MCPVRPLTKYRNGQRRRLKEARMEETCLEESRSLPAPGRCQLLFLLLSARPVLEGLKRGEERW